jgi:hypothetical protein
LDATLDNAGAVIAECAALHVSGSTNPSLLKVYVCALLYQQDWTAARFLGDLHEPVLKEWSKVALCALKNQAQAALHQLHVLAASSSSPVQQLDTSLATVIPTYCEEIARAYRRSLLKNWSQARTDPPDYYQAVLGTVDDVGAALVPPPCGCAQISYRSLADAAAFFEAQAL